MSSVCVRVRVPQFVAPLTESLCTEVSHVLVLRFFSSSLVLLIRGTLKKRSKTKTLTREPSAITLICGDSRPARRQTPVCLLFSLLGYLRRELSENPLCPLVASFFLFFVVVLFLLPDHLGENGGRACGRKLTKELLQSLYVVEGGVQLRLCMCFYVLVCVFPTPSSMPFYLCTSHAERRRRVRTDLCLTCERGPITQRPSFLPSDAS